MFEFWHQNHMSYLSLNGHGTKHKTQKVSEI